MNISQARWTQVVGMDVSHQSQEDEVRESVNGTAYEQVEWNIDATAFRRKRACMRVPEIVNWDTLKN